MTLTLSVRYLCGWAMATDPANRSRPEWPPHPTRVFMALAAAHFQTGAEPSERAALEWLEGLGAPQIRASEAHGRDPVTSYVPVNDSASPLKGTKVLPALQGLAIGRDRQPRGFPVAIPLEDTVHFTWPSTVGAAEHRATLGPLCEKVTSIGHSASLVQTWVSDEAPEPTWIPREDAATHRLRVPAPGLLQHLERTFELRQRPAPGLSVGYGPPATTPAPEPAGSVFEPDLLILRRADGRALPLVSTQRVLSVLRAAIMAAGPQPSPEFICGHEPDGARSRQPHLALVPLADVAHPHALGHLLGVGIALPEGLSPERRIQCLRAIASVERLTLGSLGEWQLAPEDRETPPWTLRSTTWARPSRRWASVTPVVLDRFPKRPGEAEETVAASCAHIGLPRPVHVAVSAGSPFRGVPLAGQFPALVTGPGRPKRFHQHAVLVFETPVRGPVVIGAGRYRGYGFFRPLTARESGVSWPS